MSNENNNIAEKENNDGKIVIQQLIGKIKDAMMHLETNYDVDGNKMNESDAYACLDDALEFASKYNPAMNNPSTITLKVLNSDSGKIVLLNGRKIYGINSTDGLNEIFFGTCYIKEILKALNN
ncbi:MAG: hypothetical protein SCALA702_00450 [Melioribacteraceae bacterium]|nr:MAG: hypothetical protein SCALA702_00450 [Melioribacteraceae bacterium]